MGKPLASIFPCGGSIGDFVALRSRRKILVEEDLTFLAVTSENTLVGERSAQLSHDSPVLFVTEGETSERFPESFVVSYLLGLARDEGTDSSISRRKGRAEAFRGRGTISKVGGGSRSASATVHWDFVSSFESFTILVLGTGFGGGSGDGSSLSTFRNVGDSVENPVTVEGSIGGNFLSTITFLDVVLDGGLGHDSALGGLFSKDGGDGNSSDERFHVDLKIYK